MHLCRLLGCFAVASFSLLAFAVAQEWPTERGDNARTGATPEEVAVPLQAIWSLRAPAPPRLAWSSAEGRVMEGKLIGHRIRFDDAFRTVISEGRVYFGSTVDHQVQCVELKSGEILWSFFTGGPVRLAPTVAGPSLLFGSDDGHVYCLEKETGALQWKRRVAPAAEWLLARGEMISKWPIRTGVLVHRGVAYYGAGIFPHENVYLEGADLQTGEPIWRADNLSVQDAGRDDISPQGYLLATDDLLFVPSGGSLPAAFDLASGTLLHKRTHAWRTTAGGVVGGTRALLADGQIYASGPHHFLAMEEKTGDVGFAWIEGRQMAIQDDQAYVATGARLARLDRIAYAEASRQRQKRELQIYNASRATAGANAAKQAELRQQVEDAREALKELEKIGIDWQVATEDEMSLLVTGSHVFLGGPGRVTAYRKDNGEQAWQQEVEGEPRGLAAAAGHLLVSTDGGVITCFAAAESAPRGVPSAHRQRADSPAQVDPVDPADRLLQLAAQEILETTGIRKGFCLVLGCERGDLALELARQSDLKIYCVEPDAENVERSRARLHEAGVYGHRVVVHHGDYHTVPYSNFFANLIVSEELVRTGRVPAELPLVARHLKPVGGVICLGRPQRAGAIPVDRLTAALATLDVADQSEPSVVNGYALLTRGKLPGAGNWSHQYGNPDNTAVSRETRVKGSLGVLWYGDPGPDQMVNRHEGATGPLAVDGRLFVQGESAILAYDAYNGVHLWTCENPDALRTGVFQNQNPGNLAAGDVGLFHSLKDKCYQLDVQTGDLVATHSLPPEADEGEHVWGYVALHQGVLYGTATVRQELDARQRRRGRVTEEATDWIFAIDLATRDHLWSYQGKSISHHTIAIGADRVCFIDSSLTSEERQELLDQDKSRLTRLTGEERKLAEERLKSADVRMAVAVDARTGEKLWATPVDVTDCSEIGIGGGKLTMMHSDGKLVLCGANANGHYWSQFVAGEFKRRRLVVLSAANGYKLWAKDANYLHRPIIIGNAIIAEPWMIDLESGVQINRSHPVTGEPIPWTIMRTGHHCGMMTGCDSGMLLFRSGSTGFADLNEDEGIRHFAGHRLGCWINAIAANGLVMIPEASAGCVCQFSISSTIVLEPREPRNPWTVFSAVGDLTPVKHLAVNFGAPGDRKDARGRLWLSYPRYKPYRKTSLEVEFDLQPRFASDQRAAKLAPVATQASGPISAAGFVNVSHESSPPIDADAPWLYQSWANNLAGLVLPLTDPGDQPARYTIRLHFADLRADSGATSLRVLIGSGDAVREVPVHLNDSGQDTIRPTIVDVEDLHVSGNLAIEFQVDRGVPLINAIEAIRQD